MSFETPITIREALNKIQSNKYLLPAIQREFVWKSEKIENLFDSLMNDYPIGSFLFWSVEKPRDYRFYKFIQKYNQKYQNHNELINLADNQEIIAILDGQQRLTALYIGLLGSYTEKLPRYRWDNPLAFPEKNLCLNLFDGDSEKKYEFKFCTTKEITQKNEKTYWFKINEILKIQNPYEIYPVCANLCSDFNKELEKQAYNKLVSLYELINNKRIINFYLEKENDLDKVLNIFIRINSAGTKLNYSDLLLSIATAQWNNRDAREEIYKAVDDLNNIGNGFDLDKDFVLKSCLYFIKEIKNIKFQVNNFKKENMDLIEMNWEKILLTLKITLNLFKSFGYSKDNLSSNICILPVALYIFKNNIDMKIIDSPIFSEDRKLMKEWIIKSTLKRIFSGTENILKPIRDIILDNDCKKFPLIEIKEKLKSVPGRSINFSDEDIEALLDYRYSDTNTFSILQLLYPNLDYRNNFHIDHIFPKSKFNKKYLEKLGLNIKEIYDWNYLANLQLLDGNQNIQKNDKNFIEWVNLQNFSENDKKDYYKKNYIPESLELNLNNFNEFIVQRDSLLLEKLKVILK
ncbi:MAG: DUF262 domain-containing protein [Cetobacterium sp.]